MKTKKVYWSGVRPVETYLWEVVPLPFQPFLRVLPRDPVGRGREKSKEQEGYHPEILEDKTLSVAQSKAVT